MALLKNEQTKEEVKNTDDKSAVVVDAKKDTKKSDVKEVKSAKKKSSNAYRTIVKPLITEKAANLGTHNKYVFEVSMKTNKIEVAKAINDIYGIKPVCVNMIRMEGKKMNYGRISGKRKDWKKAIVTLPEGKTINIYEGV